MNLKITLSLFFAILLMPAIGLAEPAPRIRAELVAKQTVQVTIKSKIKSKKRTKVLVFRAAGDTDKFKPHINFVINASQTLKFTERVGDAVNQIRYKTRLRGAANSNWSRVIKVNFIDDSDDDIPAETPDPQQDPKEPNLPAVKLPDGATACPRSEVLKVYELVNLARTTNGLSSVSEHSALAVSSQMFSASMASKQVLSHDGWYENILASGYKGSSAGQNIAYYGQLSATQVMKSWMNSAGHRANILSAAFTDLGVGCVIDAKGLVWWTQDFGG